MTQEHKELLLKDLSSRLPYGVKISVNDKVETLQGINTSDNVVEYDSFLSSDIEEVRPYLFPLSSMTEEQYYELQNCSSDDCLEHMELVKTLRDYTDFTHWPLYSYRVIDWFHKNHFDYRGLIPMGLAKDATGLNIY